MLILLGGCHRDFLDKRPNMAEIRPESIADVQAMLDNTSIMNESSSSKILATIGADEYYYTIEEWRRLATATYRNGYLWNKEVFEGEESLDWNYGYQKILYCNIALETLEKITPTKTEEIDYNRAKGTALFHRSFVFYELLQLFGKPFIPNGNNNTLGIVLKLDAEIDKNPGRATVAECYAQIILDLSLAKDLLNEEVVNKNRPSKYAVMALLCRVFLAVGEYQEAAVLAEELIALIPLIDYTTYLKETTHSFPMDTELNPEVIFRSMIRYGVTQLNYSLSEELLDLYDDNDTRQNLFFRMNNNKPVFCGSYYGSTSSFSGLAIDEVHLIGVECYLHLDLLGTAIEKLAFFQSKRYYELSELVEDKETLIDIVFEERRKQLLLRGTRWEDLRRLGFVLNRDVFLERPEIDGVAAVLSPRSDRYVWRLSDSAIDLGGLEQN